MNYIKTLILLGLSCTAQAILAQERDLSAGFKIEPLINWSKSDSKNISGNGGNLDFSFGVIVNKNVGSRVSISSGLNMSYINPSFTVGQANLSRNNTAVSSVTENIVFDYHLRYVDLPLILQTSTRPNNGLAFMGEFGLLAGYLIRSKFDLTSSKFNLENVDLENPDEEDKIVLGEVGSTNSFDIGINKIRFNGILGLGVKKEVMDESEVQASLRYNFAIRSFPSEEKWKINNNHISINLAFIF
ncbi:MAG: outer membrane beta-barrel protein [Bacteroidia bacterium]